MWRWGRREGVLMGNNNKSAARRFHLCFCQIKRCRRAPEPELRALSPSLIIDFHPLDLTPRATNDETREGNLPLDWFPRRERLGGREKSSDEPRNLGCERVLDLTRRTPFSGAERKGGKLDGVIMGCSCVPLGERYREKKFKTKGGVARRLVGGRSDTGRV